MAEPDHESGAGGGSVGAGGHKAMELRGHGVIGPGTLASEGSEGSGARP